MGWINLKNGDQSDASQINGIANELTSHETDKLNPHVVTKNQVGLPNVDNTSDMNKPISTLVKSALDGKAESSHNHQTSDILYFDVEVSNNVDVSANTNSRHTHTNSSILNSITDAIIVNWNTAYNHISDVVKHITGSERNLWNTVSNKVDKVTGKQLSSNDFTTTEKTKLSTLNNYDDTAIIQSLETKAVKSNVKKANLLSINWVDKKQDLTIDGITTDTKGIIGLSSGYDYSQAVSAQLSYEIIGNNIVRITANGSVPTVTLEIMILVLD